MDSSSKSYADAVRGQETNSWWRKYQAENEEAAMLIAIEKSREIVKVSCCLITAWCVILGQIQRRAICWAKNGFFSLFIKNK